MAPPDRKNRPVAVATRVLALVVGVALLAAGCGGSGHSGSAAATTATGGQAATAKPAAVRALLDRLRQELPASTVSIPDRWSSSLVDRRYLTVLFDDAQSVWRREFQESHVTYKPARLVFFVSKTDSPCGREDSGPFYCPADGTVYLDLRFFAELLRQAGSTGTAEGFIVGHEIGHHVQQLLGISDTVARASETDPEEKNALSVQVELQADCLAGVWGSSAYRRSHLSRAALSQALKAAHVIGDDYMQQAAGFVVDEQQFTHGSSKQRRHWVSTGFQSGRPSACDTFAGG